MEDDRSSDRFDEARIRQILRRAIEIDERVADTVNVSELQAIAASVGISPEAVDQALAEMRRAEKSRKRSLKAMRWVRRIVTAVGAFAFGLMTVVLSAMSEGVANRAVMVAALAVLSAIVLMLALYNRARGDQRTYQIDNAVIWFLFVVASRGASSAAIHPGSIAWLLLAVIGAFLIRGRKSEPPRLSRDSVIERAFGFLRQSRGDASAERRISPP